MKSILAVLVLALGAASLDASDYYLSPTGNDAAVGSAAAPFWSLTRAGQVARPGDRVIVTYGTYLWTAPQVFAAAGTASQRIIIQGQRFNGMMPTLDPRSVDFPNVGGYIRFAGGYVTVSDLSIATTLSDLNQANTMGKCYGLDIAGSHTLLQRLNVSGLWGSAISIRGQLNPYMAGTPSLIDVVVDQCTVRDCIWYNNPTDPYGLRAQNGGWPAAVSGQFVGQLSITNCSVQRNFGEGIGFYACDTGTFSGNEVADNFSVNIYADNARNLTIESNQVINEGLQEYRRTGYVAEGIGLANEPYDSYFGVPSWDRWAQNIVVRSNVVQNSVYGIKAHTYNRGVLASDNVSISDITLRTPSPGRQWIEYYEVAAVEPGSSPTIDTSTVRLVIYDPATPSIVQRPIDAYTTVGQTAPFVIRVIAGTKPLSYRWQRAPIGSTTFTDIAGATTASWTTPTTTLADDGAQYRCVVSNSVASVTSRVVALHVAPLGGSGSIAREVWTGVTGNLISDIPLTRAPDLTDTLDRFETPSDWADAYGTRMRGLLTAPTTGSYTFWIASDDQGELWLSSDASAANKVRIASVPVYTGSREWTRYPEQRSASITLTAGQRYYIEALQKEGAGGDNLAVAWSTPGQPAGAAPSIVPGSQLSPYVPSTPTLAAPTNLTATAGNTRIDLSWSAVSGAGSYTVLRSTTNGSGFVPIASGVTLPKYYDSGLTNGTTYFYVVRAVNSSTTSANSNQANATPTASGFFAAKVNFQPASAPAVSGYLIDSGATYATRSGQTYGWSRDISADTRDRNSTLSPDQQHDTLVHMQKKSVSSTWDIAAPAGTYRVRVVVGDPSYTDTHAINAEGVQVISGSTTTANRWLDNTITVIVTDGTLTLSVGSGGRNTKIDFTEIMQVSTAVN